MTWSPPNSISTTGEWSQGLFKTSYSHSTRTEYSAFSATNTGNHKLQFDTSDNKWYDNTSGEPSSFSKNNGSVVTDPSTLGTWINNTDTMQCYTSGTLRFAFTMTGWSTGPTVTSITDDTVVTPDTISNTDFTLLKNGTAYANSNISVTLGTFDPVDTPRFYDYTLTYDGTAYYHRTIDSKSYEEFYYDDSWTSSPSSGRSNSSTRILNVLSTIPSTAVIKGNGNPLTTVFQDNSRVMYHTYSATISGVATTIYIHFYSDNKSVNGNSEITGQFIETRRTATSRVYYESPTYIIGAQASMTYTQNILGVTTTFSVKDWVHSDEIEGDGYPPPVSTTSNGGGKPDRYPLIMTNLFNRNRSLYSIGMTHKDTWDLFL